MSPRDLEIVGLKAGDGMLCHLFGMETLAHGCEVNEVIFQHC
jgi:hypothetical protein